MSVFRSDLNLEARDVTGTGAEADVALNLATGNIRLSILWTQDIQLSADDADQVADALRRAAAGIPKPRDDQGSSSHRGPVRPTKSLSYNLLHGFKARCARSSGGQRRSSIIANPTAAHSAQAHQRPHTARMPPPPRSGLRRGKHNCGWTSTPRFRGHAASLPRGCLHK